MQRWPALVALAVALPVAAAAETERTPPPELPAGVPAPPPEPQRHWYVFAAPFSTPETDIGLGAVAGVHDRLCAECEPSSVHVEAAYTLRDQFTVSVAPRIFASRSFALGLYARYALFPDVFHGIGPRTPPDGEKFTPRTLELLVTPEVYVVPGKLRLGPKAHLRRETIVAYEPGRLLASGAVYGVDGYSAIGLGASVTWDSRDSQFFPHRGSYLEAWYLHYPGALGHHRTFGRAAIDALEFVPLGGDHVLALNASFAATEGDAPFTLLPSLGGVHTPRGIRDGRYRDQVSWGTQVEWRFPIVWRLRGVAFGGVGAVAPDLGALTGTPLRAAGGAGVRFRLTDDGVHLRADLAYDLGSAGGLPDVYMLVLEAF